MIDPTDPAVTLLFVLTPLLVTFLAQRLYLHLINHNTDLYILGHNVHHLFVGIAMAVPAALVLAFPLDSDWLRLGALAVLGSGVSMILDEFVFLIATDGSNDSYLKPISLWSAIVLHAGTVALLLLLYALSM